MVYFERAEFWHRTGRGADEDRAKQLAAALAALDSNDENSLINRLVREIHRARQAVLNAVNPDALDSPMAIIKATLTDLLNEHARSQAEMLRAQQDQSRVSAHTRTSLYLSRATIYLTNHLLRSSYLDNGRNSTPRPACNNL